MRLAVLLILLVLLLLLSGCLLKDERAAPSPTPVPALCQGEGPAVWGALDLGTKVTGEREHDPRHPWRTVMAMRGPSAFLPDVVDGNATIELLGNGTERLAIVDVEPTEGARFTLTVDGHDCRGFRMPEWDPTSPREGARAEVGKGALVYTAGFWENGTLFYTNMPEIHEADDGEETWPRAGWYSWEGDDPLQVYVYDKATSERPPHWGAGNQASATPVADSLPGRYFTTIKGFNEALKGLSTSTLHVVRVAPEDAYTREGYEKHPLYGDALVFLIRIEAVADQPCPADAFGSGTVSRLCFRR